MVAERVWGLVDGGDARSAVEVLYREHRVDVTRFVRSRTGAGGAVDDVCQEVWAAVARALPKLGRDVPLRPWILGVARFKTIDAWRRDGGVETLDTQLREGGALASLMGIRAPTTPSRDLSRRRRGTAIRGALAVLDPDDRELLELRFVHGLKPAEIARVLGGELAPNTIAQRVVRATRRLRASFAEAGIARG